MTLERFLNALMVLILCGVLLGALGVQFLEHEQPCPLCLLQRLGMIGVACGALLNMQFGVRMSHYALSLLSALGGGAVALRQISLHVCPGFSTFGVPVLGMSLYTWSFFVFVCCILGISVLLFLYDPNTSEIPAKKLSFMERSAFAWIALIALVNVLATYFQCGFGPCVD